MRADHGVAVGLILCQRVAGHPWARRPILCFTAILSRFVMVTRDANPPKRQAGRRRTRMVCGAGDTSTELHRKRHPKFLSFRVTLSGRLLRLAVLMTTGRGIAAPSEPANIEVSDEIMPSTAGIAPFGAQPIVTSNFGHQRSRVAHPVPMYSRWQ